MSELEGIDIRLLLPKKKPKWLRKSVATIKLMTDGTEAFDGFPRLHVEWELKKAFTRGRKRGKKDALLTNTIVEDE